MVLATPVYNNVSLHNFSQQLYTIPTPENVTIIEHMRKCENLGNSNHLDFMAAILVQTDLTQEEIIVYYSQF